MMRFNLRWGWLLVVGFLSICLDLPAAVEMEKFLDLSYGAHERQKLDIYKAKQGPAKRPAVIWVHGGGWSEGDKRNLPQGIGTLADVLVTNGFVAVSFNYRFAATAIHPAQVDDVQRAVRWLRHNAAEYNIDPDRIGAMGLSAGGHLVSMLAARDTRAKQGDELDRYSSQVQAAVSFAGPTQFKLTPELTSPVMIKATEILVGTNATDAIKADASPVTHVTAKSSPVLFVVGTADTFVPNPHATQMAEAMRRAGVEQEVLVLKGEGHGLWSNHPKAVPPAIEFFKKKLKPSL